MITVALIALNALVFAVGPDPVEFGAIPYELSHPGQECVARGQQVLCGEPTGAGAQPPTWLTPFSSMFMHGGVLHLLGNMVFLWVFGNTVEDSMGRARFVAFYLLGGLVAIGAQTLIEPNAVVPTVGASGAVAGVLGGYAVLYSRARVVTVVLIVFFFTVITLPAVVLLGLWFGLQLLFAAADLAQPTGGGGGVAYFAHVGGFLFGLAAIRLVADRVHHDYDSAQRLPVY